MAVPGYPEVYSLPRGELVPNSRLPVLVYRHVLPQPWNAETAREFCEANHWQKRGEWGVITVPHFHPNSHECYAVFQGSSRLVLGREQDDTSATGVEVDVFPGDIIVIPAGVSHRSLSSSGNYRYIGVYPETGPRWRNVFCQHDESVNELVKEIGTVEVPEHDPVFGLGGPLVLIWSKALGRHNHREVSAKL
ncbi:hypothetical protein CC80DRAFT_537866 [Byssothecium circinans]|uniref:Cupin type-1 domain-containing protein n=1 Tax=Byssothecium circinans TaxID=147558 RepID=A0A6A5TJR8_9PLEO|nr:hypothetical protein CC80DRAFT_537866 [Byssothecium circinans]